MFGRSGYQAIPLGDFDQFQQSNTWLSGSQRGFFPLGRTQDPWDQAERGIGTPQGLSSQICHGVVTALVFLLTILTFPISGWFLLKTVPTYERVIVFRLGRIRAPKGPGLVLLLPFIDHWQRVDLRTRAFSIPPCKLTSQDGALVSIGADVQFRVCDPVLSVMTVKDLNMATRMTAQNVMTRILLKKYLREIQTEKLKISDQLLLEINDITRSWGLEVDRVELILEAVLQGPPDTAVAGTSNRMNSSCGVQGLDSLQQLALHFFGKSLVAAADTGMKEPLSTVASVSEPCHILQHEASNVLRQEAPSVSPPRPSSRAFWADRIRLIGSGGEEIQAQVEHVEVKSDSRPPVVPGSTLVQEIKQHFDPEDFLLTMEDYLSESLVNQIRACYQFNVLLPGGKQNTYFIDLSTGHGKTGHGLPDHPPDVVLEMAECDLGPLVWGDLNPLNAYVSGKLRAQGDLSKALKLELLFKAMGQNRMS